MPTHNDPQFLRAFDRQMLRTMFQSLFWSVIAKRRRTGKFTQQQIADALGVHKSSVSRSFTVPPNWTIDKMADIADALGIEIKIEARDRADGARYSPSGTIEVVTGSRASIIKDVTRAVTPTSSRSLLQYEAAA